MAKLMVTREAIIASDFFIVEDMPRTVARAPGPNIMGMARGTKAIASPCRAAPLPALGITPPEGEGRKRLKPMRIRIMPPTIRTMLRGTPKIRNTNVPEQQEEKRQERGV